MADSLVATIGEVLAEIMAIDEGDGFLEPMRLVGPFPSGAPAIFIDQVAKLGQRCGIVGCVGNDDFGRLNIERLRRDGVDVSALDVHPEAATGTAFVRYRRDGSRDFIFNIKHGACAHITLDGAAESLLDRTTHLHVMGSSLFSRQIVEIVHHAVGAVKSRGGTVSLDPNVRKELLQHGGVRQALAAILDQTDVFLPSGPELFLFARAQDETAAIREILSRGIRAVVLKRGADGASYHDHSVDLFVPGVPVDEVDPTGAGDCFGATFVVSWLAGVVPERALRLANAAGALAVTRKGPMEGTSTRAEIDQLLARHGTRVHA